MLRIYLNQIHPHRSEGQSFFFYRPRSCLSPFINWNLRFFRWLPKLDIIFPALCPSVDDFIAAIRSCAVQYLSNVLSGQSIFVLIVFLFFFFKEQNIFQITSSGVFCLQCFSNASPSPTHHPSDLNTEEGSFKFPWLYRDLVWMYRRRVGVGS